MINLFSKNEQKYKFLVKTTIETEIVTYGNILWSEQTKLK